MNNVQSDKAKTRAEEKRRSRHTIRFFDSEWERVEAFAEARGLPTAEFVRFAALAAIEDGGNSFARLAPLIETTFRGTYVLATRLRDQMLDAGEQDEIDSLVVMARDLQDKLQNKVSANRSA